MKTSKSTSKNFDVGIIGLVNKSGPLPTSPVNDADAPTLDGERSISYTDRFFGGPQQKNNALYSMMRPEIDPHITDPDRYSILFLKALAKIKKIKEKTPHLNAGNEAATERVDEIFDDAQDLVRDMLDQVFSVECTIVSTGGRQ
jgi:hypothetical protein